MLQNAYFLAKIGADTAENEQHLAEILPTTGNYPTRPPGRRPPGTPLAALTAAAAGLLGWAATLERKRTEALRNY